MKEVRASVCIPSAINSLSRYVGTASVGIRTESSGLKVVLLGLNGATLFSTGEHGGVDTAFCTALR